MLTPSHAPAGFARSQGTAERMGGCGSRKSCRYSAKNGLYGGSLCVPRLLKLIIVCSPPTEIQRVTPDPALPANMTPLRAPFGRDARPLIDTTTLSID